MATVNFLQDPADTASLSGNQLVLTAAPPAVPLATATTVSFLGAIMMTVIKLVKEVIQKLGGAMRATGGEGCVCCVGDGAEARDPARIRKLEEEAAAPLSRAAYLERLLAFGLHRGVQCPRSRHRGSHPQLPGQSRSRWHRWWGICSAVVMSAICQEKCLLELAHYLSPAVRFQSKRNQLPR